MSWLDLMQMFPIPGAGIGRTAANFATRYMPAFNGSGGGGVGNPDARYFDDAGYYNGGDIDYHIPPIPFPPLADNPYLPDDGYGQSGYDGMYEIPNAPVSEDLLRSWGVLNTPFNNNYVPPIQDEPDFL